MSRMQKQKKSEKISRSTILGSFYDYQFLDFDHKSVIEADISKQKYGFEPRPYYVDIKYKCRKCKVIFLFTAKEQKTWYEEYGFMNRSHPVNCYECRRLVRQEKELHKEYSLYKKEDDAKLSPEEAKRVSEMISTLFEVPFSEPLRSRYNHLIKLSEQKST